MIRDCFITVLLLGAFASAQTTHVIFPSDHVDRSGVGHNTIRHITGGVMRNQFMYDRWDLKIPNGRMITKVGFRQWIRSISGGGVSVDVEVRMGHGTRGTDRNSMSTTFADNYVGAHTVVHARKMYKLPSFPTPRTLPPTNYVLIPLDRGSGAFRDDDEHGWAGLQAGERQGPEAHVARRAHRCTMAA